MKTHINTDTIDLWTSVMGTTRIQETESTEDAVLL